MMDKALSALLLVACAVLFGWSLGSYFGSEVRSDSMQIDCDVANRTVIHGKPYICHPMPEGTGHHD